MTTHFIEAEIDLAAIQAGADRRKEIEAQLQSQGEPLRWAITAMNGHKASVEAVILNETLPSTVA